MTISAEHIVIYCAADPVDGALFYQGRFFFEGKILPIEFYGRDSAELKESMSQWILSERERLARLDASREYLRKPEAIAERVRKAAETRAAKKALRS